jgi:hypothetical protein
MIWKTIFSFKRHLFDNGTITGTVTSKEYKTFAEVSYRMS